MRANSYGRIPYMGHLFVFVFVQTENRCISYVYKLIRTIYTRMYTHKYSYVLLSFFLKVQYSNSSLWSITEH